MASRAFYQMTQSLVQRLTVIQGQFSVGSSGAVSLLKGSGVSAVVRVQPGVYKIQLEDSYNRLLMLSVCSREAAGTPVLVDASDALLVVGNLYVITTLGDATVANWRTLGVPADTVPAVGVAFVAAATGAGVSASSAAAPVAGTATADAQVVNLAGDPQETINTSQPGNATTGKLGGYFYVVVRSGVGVVTDPPSGSILFFDVLLRNSSIKGQGE